MIALGWALKASRFIPEPSWPPIERLTYFVFYPAFLIPAVWRADFAGGAAGPVAVATVVVVAVTYAAVGTVSRLLFPNRVGSTPLAR